RIALSAHRRSVLRLVRARHGSVLRLAGRGAAHVAAGCKPHTPGDRNSRRLYGAPLERRPRPRLSLARGRAGGLRPDQCRGGRRRRLVRPRALGAASRSAPAREQAAMTGRYLEDFAVGQTFGSGRLRLTAERIKSFAAEFDPQPFHLDEEAARDSIFRGLAASGWHTAAATMRLLVE